MNIFFLLAIIIAILGFIEPLLSRRLGVSLLTFQPRSQQNVFQRRSSRIKALNNAKEFLSPYKDIWGSFSLSNRFCTVRYNNIKKEISCKSKIADKSGRKYSFSTASFYLTDIDDYWNTLCNMFTMNTNYEQVYDSCKYVATISLVDYEQTEVIEEEKPIVQEYENSYQVKTAYDFKEFYPQIKDENLSESDVFETKEDDEDNLLDINNASEKEIAELPGINIIIAKRIVKERNDNGLFSSKSDFFERVNMKSHFAAKIKNLITIKKKAKNEIQIENNERIVDFE